MCHESITWPISGGAPTAAQLEYIEREDTKLPVYVATAGGVSDSFWGWGLPVSYLINRDGQFIGRPLRRLLAKHCGRRAWRR